MPLGRGKIAKFFVGGAMSHTYRRRAHENLQMKSIGFVSYQLAYHAEFVKNIFGMWRIQHFIC
jgi:hypothetical protein